MTIFITDGSVNGLYCSLFKSFTDKLIPDEIITSKVYQPQLGDYPVKIETDAKKANRVKTAIIGYAGINAARSLKARIEQPDEKAQIIAFDYAFKILSLKRDVSDEISDPIVSDFVFTERKTQNRK